MTTEARIQLTSSELGSLWTTFISTSARLAIYASFRDKTIDKEAQNILANYIMESQNVKNKIINVLTMKKQLFP